MSAFNAAPISIACPDVPCPTSTVLSAEFYPTKVDLIRQAHVALGLPAVAEESLSFEYLHLSPKFDFSKNE